MHISKLLIPAFMLLILLHQPASAADKGARVKSLYGKYQVALSMEDYEKATTLAAKAWKASEKAYGDSRQTGDFAYNYAVLGKALTKNKTGRIKKAFERSIELAYLHKEAPAKTSVRRHVAYAAFLIKTRAPKRAANILVEAEKIATKSHLNETEEFASIMHRKAEAAYDLKNFEEAKLYIETSLQAFDDLEQTTTRNRYLAKVVQADIIAELGNWREALLTYETIYLNIDRHIYKRDKLIGLAYLKKKKLVDNLVRNKTKTEDQIKKNQFCADCWPNFEEKYRQNIQKNSLYNIDIYERKSWPQHVPRLSGFVEIMYDTDNAGKPVNFRFIEGSHDGIFDKSATNSLKRWRVSDIKTGKPAQNVTDLVALLTYNYHIYNASYVDFYGNQIDRTPRGSGSNLNVVVIK